MQLLPNLLCIYIPSNKLAARDSNWVHHDISNKFRVQFQKLTQAYAKTPYVRAYLIKSTPMGKQSSKVALYRPKRRISGLCSRSPTSGLFDE